MQLEAPARHDDDDVAADDPVGSAFSRPLHPRVESLRGADLWLHLVHVGIDVLHGSALHQITLEQLAERAGVREDLVREQFRTVDDFIINAIQIWNGARLAPLLPVARQHGAVAFLRAITVANIADPAFTRFLMGAVNIASTPGHPMASELQDLWLAFQALVQRTLTDDIASGREPDTMDPASGAEQLIALYEGLELQSLLRPRMHLLDSYDRAVRRLRDGWAVPYEPVVWII